MQDITGVAPSCFMPTEKQNVGQNEKVTNMNILLVWFSQEEGPSCGEDAERVCAHVLQTTHRLHGTVRVAVV